MLYILNISLCSLFSVRQLSRLDMEYIIPNIVHYDGNVSRVIPTVVHSACDLDMASFPWDTQFCHLNFGSWTYEPTDVIIRNVGYVI